ncbi:MAG: Rgg/GadR/MutR family transcriptional regulator [Streptococcaceae bacterium]|nr:Rgg/GadR/MutR family transcriptional regulator [Streptococcaceae bacterium]
MSEKSLYGEKFRELRRLSGKTYADFDGIVSATSLKNFEKGASMLATDKLASALALMNFKLSDMENLASDAHPIALYGRVFHDLRRQRGYRRDFFESLGVSPLRLKLFEENHIMLPYDILDAMLGLMHMPEADFGYALNGNTDNYFIHFVNEMDIAQYTGDTTLLKTIEREGRKYAAGQEAKFEFPDDDPQHDYSTDRLTRQYTDFRVLELTAKASYTQLTDAERTEIGDFLFGIEIWVEYSLGILALNAWQLPYVTIHGILSDIANKKSQYIGKVDYRRRILQAGFQRALSLTLEGSLEQARHLLQLVAPFAVSVDIRIQGLYYFAKGFLTYQSYSQKGRQEMQEVVSGFTTFNEHLGLSFCEKWMAKYVEE